MEPDHARGLVGPDTSDLVRIALWACLIRSDNAAVPVGFSTPEQVPCNLACLGQRPPAQLIAQVRAIMAGYNRSWMPMARYSPTSGPRERPDEPSSNNDRHDVERAARQHIPNPTPSIMVVSRGC